MFQNIVSVDKEEHVITISENLNAVLDEVGRRFRLVWNPRTVVSPNFLGYMYTAQLFSIGKTLTGTVG